MTRIAKASRKTSETDIEIELNIDGTGKYNIDTGVNFFNHMLESFSRHSFIDQHKDWGAILRLIQSQKHFAKKHTR